MQAAYSILRPPNLGGRNSHLIALDSVVCRCCRLYRLYRLDPIAELLLLSRPPSPPPGPETRCWWEVRATEPRVRVVARRGEANFGGGGVEGLGLSRYGGAAWMRTSRLLPCRNMGSCTALPRVIPMSASKQRCCNHATDRSRRRLGGEGGDLFRVTQTSQSGRLSSNKPAEQG